MRDFTILTAERLKGSLMIMPMMFHQVYDLRHAQGQWLHALIAEGGVESADTVEIETRGVDDFGPALRAACDGRRDDRTILVDRTTGALWIADAIAGDSWAREIGNIVGLFCADERICEKGPIRFESAALGWLARAHRATTGSDQNAALHLLRHGPIALTTPELVTFILDALDQSAETHRRINAGRLQPGNSHTTRDILGRIVTDVRASERAA